MNRTEYAQLVRRGNDVFDAEHNHMVDTNNSNDYWHMHGQHNNGAISDCAMCVEDGNRRCLTGAHMLKRARRAELGRTTVDVDVDPVWWGSYDTPSLSVVKLLCDGDRFLVHGPGAYSRGYVRVTVA